MAIPGFMAASDDKKYKSTELFFLGGDDSVLSANSCKHKNSAAEKNAFRLRFNKYERVSCLPIVNRLYLWLSTNRFLTQNEQCFAASYTNAVMREALGNFHPEGLMSAVPTAGSVDAIWLAVNEYSQLGETVLTTDWHRTVYDDLCIKAGRTLWTFSLFDEDRKFNAVSFSIVVAEILQKQDSLLIVLNTPANNPTGFSLSDVDWHAILNICEFYGRRGKQICILIDLSYIEFAGERERVRKFMKSFENLPAAIFIMFVYSLSDSLLLYGLKAGALIGWSSDQETLRTFEILRNKGAGRSEGDKTIMRLLTVIYADGTLLGELQEQRYRVYETIRNRARLFLSEARGHGLTVAPYDAGRYAVIPVNRPAYVYYHLADECAYVSPVESGIRFDLGCLLHQDITILIQKMRQIKHT